MVNANGAAHLTTIGIAPEHRRRRLAERLLTHLEKALRAKGAGTVMLEVRVGNTAAQSLYRQTGYTVVQRVATYYNNGEDGFLMVKSLFNPQTFGQHNQSRPRGLRCARNLGKMTCIRCCVITKAKIRSNLPRRACETTKPSDAILVRASSGASKKHVRSPSRTSNFSLTERMLGYPVE